MSPDQDVSSSPSDDLAFLRRMAVAGRGGSAPFLPLMALFGAAFGVGFLTIYADVMSAGRLPDWTHYVPGAASIVFLIGVIWTAWRAISTRGRGLNRSAAAVWSAAFIGLIVTLAAFGIYTQDEPPTDQVYTSYMQPSMLLVMWGMAWWTSAIATHRRWLIVVAVASFAAALAAAAIGNSTQLLLLAGVCLFGLATVPAVILMWAERGRG